MIPIIIFMGVTIIGILVYFLVIKKKSSENKVLKNKCNLNEIFINNDCKRILTSLDCKLDSPSFLKLNPDTKNTSCIEMKTYEKIEHCKKSGLIFYQNSCKYIKSAEDCENEDQFTKPDPLFMNITCTEMTENEKEKYCEKNKKKFFDGKCIKKKSENQCDKSRYLSPDPKTNFTTCTRMSDDEIRRICEDLNRIFKDGQCLKKKSDEDCKIMTDTDEFLFYKKLSLDKTECIDLSDKEKVKICSQYGKSFNGVGCNCPEDTVLLNGQCLGNKTEKQCFNKNKFTKPNLATGNTSCIPMKNNEKEKYCESKNMIYYNNNCRNVFSKEDCSKEVVSDNLFKKIPDLTTNKTTCRDLTLSEKEKICKDNGMYWDENNCMEKLKKLEIKIIEQNPYDVVLELVVSGNYNLDNLRVQHIMNNPCECKDEWQTNEKTFHGCSDADNDKNTWCFVKGQSSCGISTKSIYNKGGWWRRCNKVIESFSELNESNNITLNKKYGDLKIIDINKGERKIKVKISNLTTKSKYQVKLKILSNLLGFESPFSNIIDLETSCDSEIYTRNYCRNNNGPENTTVSLVKDSRKEKGVTSWPFFKIPKIIDGKACGCRKLKKREAKELCINTYYPHFKDLNRDVIFKDSKCIPVPMVVGPPLNYSIQNLSINQDLDSNNNLIDITDVLKYRKEAPYRVKIEWSRPSLAEFENKEEVSPIEYNIFRKELLAGENYKFIHSLIVIDKTKENFIFIDGDFEKVDYNGLNEPLKSDTVYEYKIVPKNIIGEGPYCEISILTKEKRLTRKYCEDKNEDFDPSINFDGFSMKLDILNNKCISMSTIQRNIVCKSLNKIEENYENIYNPENKKCIPLTTNLKLPGKPSLVVLNKNSNIIKLNILPSNEFGLPALTDYILKWKNLETNETGRLTHGINYSEINIAGSESYSNPVYVKPNPNGLNTGIELIHNNLVQATLYQYTIEAISFNDILWGNYNGALTTSMEDNRVVGISELFSIDVRTEFSIPLDIPNINVNSSAVEFVTLLIDKFPDGKEGGSLINVASIKKYKIKRIFLPKGENLSTYFKSNISGKEIIIDLDNLSQFNSDNTEKFSISYDQTKKVYYFKDMTIEPFTNYRYYLFAMNNKVNDWSEINKYTNVQISELPPYYECKNPENLEITQDYSNTDVNKVNVRIIWDKLINPNIKRYKKWDIFKETKGYPKYEIILNSDGNRKEYQDLSDNNILVRNLEIDTDYKLKLRVIHKGILKLKNGFKFLVETFNETNIDDSFHDEYKNEKNIIKPLKDNFKTIGFTNDDDCNKNDLYYDNTIFADGKKVSFYLNNDNPRKCVSRIKDFKKIIEYCQEENNNSEYIYSSIEKKCKKLKDGEWKRENVFDKVCTRDGLNGDYIVCGGGTKVKNKYIYNKPEKDIGVSMTYPELNGKDIDPPDNTTEYLENGIRIAYEFEDCNIKKCDTLCKEKYGQLQPEAYNNSNEIPLSLSDINDNTYCKKDAKQSVIINLPSEICTSCGNADKEKIKRTWTCTDGFAGKSEITKCNKQIDNNDNLNIKENVEKGLVKEEDRIEGKWYKCHGLTDTNGNTVPHEEYKNVSYCNPPFTLQKSEKKDDSGNNIVIKRNKYFMQKTKKCTDIPYCQYQKTKDRFPAFTNYCGSQTVSTNKVCIGPDGNSTTFDNCGNYTDSGDFKLTKANKLESCKKLCEGPPKVKSLTTDGYDKWNSISDLNEGKTESEFRMLCKSRTLIEPKFYTKNVPGRGCAGCGTSDKNKEVYDICEDGMYGPDEKIKCELAPGTKNKYNEKIWNKIKNENADCDSNNEHCKIKRVHSSRIYNKKCSANEIDGLCSWKRLGEVCISQAGGKNCVGGESDCSAFCNGGTKTQNVICQDNEGKRTSKIDCGDRPIDMWETTMCNIEKCFKICNDKGNLWVGNNNKPYKKEDFDNNCKEIDAINRILELDNRTCQKDMKGCGLLNLRKVHNCIDGIGKDQKKCQEFIDSDTSGRTWVKKANKTDKYYDSNKDCFTGNDKYKENFEECHDISDHQTWDTVATKRDQYYSVENIPCGKASDWMNGNEASCEWVNATEIDTNDCQGTVFRTYKCVDEDGKTVNSRRCKKNKPPDKVSLDLKCDLKPGKWVNHAGERGEDIKDACGVCGVKQGQLVERKNKCIRSDGKRIADYNCSGELPNIKTCTETTNCICSCNNGDITTKECNALYGFNKYKSSDTLAACKRCDEYSKLADLPDKDDYNFISKKSFKFDEDCIGDLSNAKVLKSWGSGNCKKQGIWYDRVEPLPAIGLNEKLEEAEKDPEIKGIIFNIKNIPYKFKSWSHLCWNYHKLTMYGLKHNNCNKGNEFDDQKFKTYPYQITDNLRSETSRYMPRVKGNIKNRKICKLRKCKCANGTAKLKCKSEDEDSCASCNTGFTLNDNKCTNCIGSFYNNKCKKCICKGYFEKRNEHHQRMKCGSKCKDWDNKWHNAPPTWFIAGKDVYPPTETGWVDEQVGEPADNCTVPQTNKCVKCDKEGYVLNNGRCEKIEIKVTNLDYPYTCHYKSGSNVCS
jgi:hypothetical protein